MKSENDGIRVSTPNYAPCLIFESMISIIFLSLLKQDLMLQFWLGLNLQHPASAARMLRLYSTSTLYKMCWVPSLAPQGELWEKHDFVCHWDLRKSQWMLLTSAQERNSSNTQHSRIEQHQK